MCSQSSRKELEGENACNDQRADGYRVSDVFRSDESIVHAAIDKLILRIGRQVGDLDFVVELVVRLAIRALHLGDFGLWNTAQVCFHLDELGHAFCE